MRDSFTGHQQLDSGAIMCERSNAADPARTP
jgi:hypothetical protein